MGYSRVGSGDCGGEAGGGAGADGAVGAALGGAAPVHTVLALVEGVSVGGKVTVVAGR